MKVYTCDPPDRQTRALVRSRSPAYDSTQHTVQLTHMSAIFLLVYLVLLTHMLMLPPMPPCSDAASVVTSHRLEHRSLSVLHYAAAAARCAAAATTKRRYTLGRYTYPD